MFGLTPDNQKKITEPLKRQSDFNFDKTGVKNRLFASIHESKFSPNFSAAKPQRRWKFKFAGILAAVFLFASSLVYADAAKPGDALYFLDLMEEKVEMNIPRSTTAKAELKSKVIKERLEEINRLPSNDSKSQTLKADSIKKVQEKLIEAVDDAAAAKSKLQDKGRTDSVQKINEVLNNLEKTVGKEEDRMEESKKSEQKIEKSPEQIKKDAEWQARFEAIKKARLKARLEASILKDTQKQNEDNSGSSQSSNVTPPPPKPSGN